MNYSLKKWQEHLETGIKYLGAGLPEEAQHHFEASLSEAESLGIPVVLAFSQRLLATAQVKNNQFLEAESGFRRALHLCRQLENKKGIAEANAGLASVSFLKGQYFEAAAYYLRAIEVYPCDSSLLRLGVLFSDLGHTYAKLKNWEKAEEMFRKAAATCKDNGYGRGEAEIELHLGEVYYHRGNYQSAQKLFLKSAKIFAAEGDELSLANAHQYLAFLCLETNHLDEALHYQHRVIPLYLKNKQYLEASEGYSLLSYILQGCGLLDEAEECVRKSLNYYQGFELGLAVRYQNLAVIAIKQKEFNKAKKHYLEALRFFQYAGKGPKIGEVSEELTYLIKFEEEFIKENLYQWLGDRDVDWKMSSYEVMFNLAQSLKEKGNNIAALGYGWKALEIARNNRVESAQAELLIQNLSERIRKKK